MNKKSNGGSKLKPPASGQVLDMQLASPKTSITRKKQVELMITDEELEVWALLAEGRTQQQVADKMGISQATVGNRIARALERVRGWAGKQAEDWRNHQLLIMDNQISGIIDDTGVQPQPLLNEDGEQIFSSNGYPQWIISPPEAAKTRNMARVTLQKYLQHQANLLQLVVERKEVLVDKRVAIGIYNLGDFEGAASMDDL